MLFALSALLAEAIFQFVHVFPSSGVGIFSVLRYTVLESQLTSVVFGVCSYFIIPLLL